MIDGATTFFTDPKEAWNWLELYRRGRDGLTTLEKVGGPLKPTKRRKTQQGGKSSSPTRPQLEREKRAALRATSELTNQPVSKNDSEDTPGLTESGTDSDAVEILDGTLPGVTPRTVDIL
mgnify:CR=1 FL=1